jgi:hypothetical protein
VPLPDSDTPHAIASMPAPIAGVSTVAWVHDALAGSVFRSA